MGASWQAFYAHLCAASIIRAMPETEIPPAMRGDHYFSLSKNPRVDKGPQPLMFNPALTTCASERMKTQRFSYFADFAARERMREAKPVKLKKVAFSHFFDTLRAA